MEHFEVRNEDITIRFTCPNYGERIRKCESNLMINSEKPETCVRKKAIYSPTSEGIEFRKGKIFDNEANGWVNGDDTLDWDAFFFENTDYPLHVKPNHESVHLKKLTIGKEQSQHVSAEDAIIFGSINYRNQVGRTDIKVLYECYGEEKCLSFTTEVLSYKMDYRTDMRNVIRDIEEEFAMLSYSFLKETYLTFKTSDKDSTDLIWWQIFRECFDKIINATRIIINNPKRRLQTLVRYERAERMPYMPSDLENEYEEFKNDPSHLYRMEEMYLSKDTIENRFLKYALQNIADRFKRVQRNIFSILKADNLDIRRQIMLMDAELTSVVNDPFFRGIGVFRGFSQDSLVMKQAAGYRDVYEYWIILQCGYDLQEGIMQLEVKDISELYEIWCFIKVKNIVLHILKDKAVPQVNGRNLEGNFIKTLTHGAKSEVTFYRNDVPDVQIASVMYNATTDDEECLSDESKISENTDIEKTTSKTTEQRPDIVLRLSKSEDGIQYTYLFDAKYRIRDTTIPLNGGVDVPPVDAINQLHRYRDAIYYTQANDDKLKREVIGGYVLYPGNLNKEQFIGSYYQRSIDEVNIGAFPLKPGGQWMSLYDTNGDVSELLLDPLSSEDVLYQQIESWLNDGHSYQTLLESSIPQKGLVYQKEGNGLGVALVMMENYEDKLKGFSSGRIAIPLKLTESGMTLLEKCSNIGYVLFHTRKQHENKHFFKVKHACEIYQKDKALQEGYYLIQKTASRYICLTIDIEEEIDSASLNPSKSNVPYDASTERYDAQYSELSSLIEHV